MTPLADSDAQLPATRGRPATAGAPVVLQLAGVRKDYPGGVTGLRDVSLEVRRGEQVAVVGPSGSGKTSLLNIMGTLDRPTAGSVRLWGHEVAGLPDRDLAAVRAAWIGFVFQQFFLAPHLTALDNVAAGLLYAGVPRSRRRRAAAAVLHRVGLAARLGHRPAQLSAGERQRVAIARAVVGRPALILADEPTGSLDSRTGDGVLDLIQELNADGTSIVLITHDPRVAGRLNRAVEIVDGEIRVDSPAPDRTASGRLER